MPVAIMAIIFVRDFLKRRYNFDMDNVDLEKAKTFIKNSIITIKDKTPTPQIKTVQTQAQTSGKSLIMLDAGENKATVMATLRQITGFDYATAKNIVEKTPVVFMKEVSEKQADITKKALEFVGAKIQIK